MFIGILIVAFTAIAHAQWPCRDRLTFPSSCAQQSRQTPCGSAVMNYWCCQFCKGGGGPKTKPPTQQPPPPGGSGCGKTFYQSSRVISGQNARAGQFPWQLLLEANGRPGCGGSLISPYWAVTAAHCIRYGSRYSIVLGELNRNIKEGYEQRIQVERYSVHPSWNQNTFNNDVAVLKLSTPAQMNRHVQPICLPDVNVRDGTSCLISGWGKVSPRGQMHHMLQCAPMRVIDRDTCDRKNFANIRVHVTDQMICGGGSGRISGCQGDSGGPLACNVGGRWELHGAVSHGSRDCNSSQTYTVFGRIYSARRWIKQQTGV